VGGSEVKDIILDTHVWIWATIDDRASLSPRGLKLIKEAKTKWVSTISCWELAKLVERKRIGFSIPVLDWIKRSINEMNISLADLSPEIAVESTQLKGFHKDPADQIIVATSRVLGLPLLTSDRRILDFPDVETIW
jgi:PIN domain nuclease of toxin-antitoxin system